MAVRSWVQFSAYAPTKIVDCYGRHGGAVVRRRKEKEKTEEGRKRKKKRKEEKRKRRRGRGRKRQRREKRRRKKKKEEEKIEEEKEKGKRSGRGGELQEKRKEGVLPYDSRSDAIIVIEIFHILCYNRPTKTNPSFHVLLQSAKSLNRKSFIIIIDTAFK